MDYLLISPEIEEWVTEERLQDQYGLQPTMGWHRMEHGDTALIIQRHGKFKVSVWARHDPRDEWEKLLDLPTIKS